MTRRLVATYLILASVVLVALVVPLGIVNQRSQQQDLERRVERDAVALAGLTEDILQAGARPGDAALGRIVGDYAAATGARAVIVGEAGLLLADSDAERPLGRAFETRPEIARALAGDVAVGSRGSRTLGSGLVYVAVPVASGGRVHGAVRVTVPTSRVDAAARRYWLALGGIALVALLAVAVAGRALARWVTRPLNRLGGAARAAGEGDLGARADVRDGPPEVRRLARDFDDMVARLEGLVGAQREFVADASHQLRSPLTALRLRLENLASGEAAPGEAEAAIAEVDRLSRLVDELLLLARADEGGRIRAPRDVAKAAAERAATWAPVAAERGVRIETSLQPGARATASEGALEQVLDNLISNALDASPAGGRIVVAVRRDGERVVAEVTDEGPGMPEERRRRAFDRFATWREGGGTGLGLAIVRRLVEADGGEAALEAAGAGGTRAVVRLPAAAGGRAAADGPMSSPPVSGRNRGKRTEREGEMDDDPRTGPRDR